MTINKSFIAIPYQQISSLSYFLDILSTTRGHLYSHLLPEWSKILKDHLRNSSSLEFDTVVSIQRSDGHWNHDSYMHGMANGLILAQSMLNHEPNPKYLDAPQKWNLNRHEISHSLAWHRRWPIVLHSLAKILSLFH